MARIAQAIPQPPQWSVLVSVLASHPLAGLVSQSAKGAVHIATAHDPFMHAAEALATMHPLLQAPQWAVLRCVSTHALPQQV